MAGGLGSFLLLLLRDAGAAKTRQTKATKGAGAPRRKGPAGLGSALTLTGAVRRPAPQVVVPVVAQVSGGAAASVAPFATLAVIAATARATAQAAAPVLTVAAVAGTARARTSAVASSLTFGVVQGASRAISATTAAILVIVGAVANARAATSALGSVTALNATGAAAAGMTATTPATTGLAAVTATGPGAQAAVLGVVVAPATSRSVLAATMFSHGGAPVRRFPSIMRPPMVRQLPPPNLPELARLELERGTLETFAATSRGSAAPIVAELGSLGVADALSRSERLPERDPVRLARNADRYAWRLADRNAHLEQRNADRDAYRRRKAG